MFRNANYIMTVGDYDPELDRCYLPPRSKYSYYQVEIIYKQWYKTSIKGYVLFLII